MNSSDVFVEISGQRYRLDGETLRPAEKDFQSEVLKRLDGIESRLSRTDLLILWGGTAFTVLAAIIAFVEIFAPKFEKVNFTISLTDLHAKALKPEREKWE